MRRIFIFCLIFLLPFLVELNAQSLTVTAVIDSTSMWIGSQTNLSFEVSQDSKQQVVMPLFSDTIVGGVEIVEPLKVDTPTTPDGVLLVKHTYVVTAFEDSLYYIPPYPFVSGDDTIWSKSLSLNVIQPFVIDTASNQITDIKNVYTPPIYWKGIIKTILLVLLALAILVFAFFVLRRVLKKKPVFAPEVVEPNIPAYELALSKLDIIKQEKSWQHNRSKEYHTQLSEIIREYIESTYEISCLEMTSEEIFSNLNHLRFESKSAYICLQQILKLADLVKFAKWNPTPDEHELSLHNAYIFVNETKVEPLSELENLKDESLDEKA